MLCLSPSVKSLGFLGYFNPLSFFLLLWEEKPFSSVGDSVGKPFSVSFSCLGLVSPLLGDDSVFCCANLLSCFETPGKTWCIILTIFCSVMCELSVQFSHSVVSDSLQPQGLQHASPPCPSPTPGVYPNSCPSNRWCHPTISSSVTHFASCLQSLPASGSFQMNQLFPSGGQCIGVSASTSVFPMYQISFGCHYCLEWVRTCSYNLLDCIGLWAFSVQY